LHLLNKGILRNVRGTPSNLIGNVNRVLLNIRAKMLHASEAKRTAVTAYVLRALIPSHFLIEVLHANATS